MSSALLETPAAQRRPAPSPRPAARIRSTAPPLLLIANANASGLAGRRHLVGGAARLLRDFGAQVETVETGSAEDLAAAIAGEERRLVLLGGDGSVHAAANVAGPKPELAMIPAGRANNLARGLGIPLDLTAAARLAVAGVAQRIDAIEASSPEGRTLALEGVSVGYHAQARARYHGRNSADLAAGVAAGVTALARFQPLSIALESDGDLEVLRTSQLFVANFPFYGFGLHVAPGADPGDGRLDVVSIETSGRAALVAMLARLRAGTHVGRPGVRRWSASRVRIATGGRSPVIADTTNLGTGPVDLTVRPAALHLVAASR